MSGPQTTEPTAMTFPISLITRRIRFCYINYRGEQSIRQVEPISIWFGATPWHPDDQWLMRATDLLKGEIRDFAMRDISGVTYA